MKSLSQFTCTLLCLSLLPLAPAHAVLGLDPSQLDTGAISGKQESVSELCTQYELSSQEKAVHRGKPLEEQCASPAWTDDRELQVKCKLRAAAKTSQALQYCAARKNSASAMKKLSRAAAIDATAAALCLLEGYDVTSTIPVGTCGFAALAAGAWETIRVAEQIVGGKRDSGNYKVDKDGQAIDKGKSIYAQLTTVAPLALGVVWGTRYFSGACKSSGLKPIKGGFNPAAARNSCANNQAAKGRVLSSDYGGAPHADDRFVSMDISHCTHMKELENKGAQDCVATQKKLMAQKIGKLFAGLAVMRGVNLLAAKNTNTKVDDALKAVFTSNGYTAAGAMGSGDMAYSKGAYPSVLGGAETAGITASEFEEGTLESSLLKNSALGNKAADLANKLGLNDPRKLEAAMAKGGMEGLIASVGAAAGGKSADILAAANSAKPYLAQMDEGSTTYAAAGGSFGSSGGSKSDAGMNLDLGNLFGENSEPEQAPGVTEDAFRSPAKVGSIYHEDTPLNIFQIVSGKLENIQQESRIPIPR